MDNLSGLNDPEFVFSPFAAFQVDECYFCKPSSFSNTPSLLQSPLNGYQDELFLLNPNEKPLCDTDPLLLFCIDVSGSMKITSEVQQHYRHLASRGCLWQQVFMNTTCGVSTVFRCQRESILWINPVSRWVVFLFFSLFWSYLEGLGIFASWNLWLRIFVWYYFWQLCEETLQIKDCSILTSLSKKLCHCALRD